MTVEEARLIISSTKSEHLKRDMERFIKRQWRKERADGKAEKGNRQKAI